MFSLVHTGIQSYEADVDEITSILRIGAGRARNCCRTAALVQGRRSAQKENDAGLLRMIQ